MLNVTALALPQAQMTYLAGEQSTIDANATYQHKVSSAAERWAGKSRAHFSVIRKTLESMCTGHNRCVYCEDSAADEVEHIKPKNIYPSDAFLWDNYIFSCGPCNGPKGNKYAVIDAGGTFVRIDRNRNDPIVPPPHGQDGFINPRVSNPMDYIFLDLSTFFFVALPTLNQNDTKKAIFTILVLRLNIREHLVENRKNAYNQFLSCIISYIKLKEDSADAKKLNSVKSTIAKSPHKTVWEEMKRQRGNNAYLATLFNAAPELL
ncbi:HNH endonuclease [Aeromonas rivipollensis]|uniref:HNH endonuclease n=1 Tax=Aeromonas rivipollensis TaxID=948519 RepID=UPI003D1C7BC2